MKKSIIASIMICTALAAQINSVIANAEYRQYSQELYETAHLDGVTHEQKKTVLASKGLISAELAKDETKPVIYADAANICAAMIMRSAAGVQKLSERTGLIFSYPPA